MVEGGRSFERGGLVNLVKTVVSVLPKELEQSGHAVKDQKQVRTSSWWITHPGSVHTKFYSGDWLIQSITH